MGSGYELDDGEAEPGAAAAARLVGATEAVEGPGAEALTLAEKDIKKREKAATDFEAYSVVEKARQESAQINDPIEIRKVKEIKKPQVEIPEQRAA